MLVPNSKTGKKLKAMLEASNENNVNQSNTDDPISCPGNCFNIQNCFTFDGCHVCTDGRFWCIWGEKCSDMFFKACLLPCYYFLPGCLKSCGDICGFECDYDVDISGGSMV